MAVVNGDEPGIIVVKTLPHEHDENWQKILKNFGVKCTCDFKPPLTRDLKHKMQKSDFSRYYIDRVKYNYAKRDFFKAIFNAKGISQIDLLGLLKFNLELFQEFGSAAKYSDFYKQP